MSIRVQSLGAGRDDLINKLASLPFVDRSDATSFVASLEKTVREAATKEVRAEARDEVSGIVKWALLSFVGIAAATVLTAKLASRRR